MSAPSERATRRWRWRRKRSHGATMTMMEHLSELRRRLIVSMVAFLIVSTVAFLFYEPLLDFIRRPLCDLPRDLLGPQGCRLVYLKVLGGFLFRVKLTALAGILFTSPVWLYQIWAFITPGLTSKEKRYAIPFVLTSVILFGVGAFFAYVTLPTGIRILVGLGGTSLDPLLGADEYINFVGLMFLGFGVTFELPLVLFFLGLAGILPVETLRKQRKVAIVSITALAAIVTPSQDPYTLLVLAVPLYALYELTIVVLRLITRRRERAKQSV
ncbi:MAG TPA: twin-arginine translocase subunit TatC [Actinomycetota bacterium]|nr:twin-arginine translocase subunit TatC [Actinomycetota bacterium]